MDEFLFHHVGVAAKSLQTSIPIYQNLFNYQLVSGPFDDPVQNVTVCFVSRGTADPTIELVAPLGPNSPVDGILKRGGGIYHICYQVPDMQSAIDRLTGQGCLLLSGPSPAVAFEMRQIAWLMTDVNLLVELLQQ